MPGLLTRKCYDTDCKEPASGTGSGFFICVHEHVSAAGDFCEPCWLHREQTNVTWHCRRCFGEKLGGGREQWGHLCPMKLVLPD